VFNYTGLFLLGLSGVVLAGNLKGRLPIEFFKDISKEDYSKCTYGIKP
jgi:hypothetical protein